MVAYSKDTVGVDNKPENTNVIELFDAPDVDVTFFSYLVVEPFDGSFGAYAYNNRLMRVKYLLRLSQNKDGQKGYVR